MKHALGLIETVGMAAAVEAADTALKSANISLIGIELTKGDGMVTVKIEGDVGAVQAAVESARQAAALVSRVYSTKVIPRPSEGIEKIVFSKETKGIEKVEEEVKIDSKPADAGVPIVEETVEIEVETTVEATAEVEEIIDTAEVEVMEAVEEIIKTVEEKKEADTAEEVVEAPEEVIETQEIVEAEENEEVFEAEEPEVLKTATCNLCHDPDCSRKKGESKDRCIHHKINKEA